MPHKLTQLKVAIKELLVSDLEKALYSLKDHLRPDCAAYDEIIIALERTSRINKALQKGLISFHDADILLNRIVNSVVFTINNLKETDLAPDTP